MIRLATIEDIPQIQVVRNAVKENRLSDPALVTDADCVHYLTVRGKGFVAQVGSKIVGFAIADLEDHNVWALFVDPDFEGSGIGRVLHDTMLEWYFAQTQHTIWLGTAPGTRAEKFYRRAGWVHAGVHGKEIKFEMSFSQWKHAR